MATFAYAVTVSANTAAEAERVMVERVGYSEDYGFDYLIDYARADGANVEPVEID
jgi:hypothetical protein